MTIRVLGTTTVDEGSLSPRDRTVLAALAVRPGRVLGLDELADASWAGGELPDTWPKQLQAAVSRLRRLLGRRSITTFPDGYALEAAASIDWRQFEQDLASARLHLDAGEPDRAVEAYRRALALWRGVPFGDLPEWPSARDAAARLEEQHRTAEEELQRAHLECGEHRSVVAAAEQLVRDAPFRESRWHLLALANYRSGRQAEALAALRSARRHLADELGIEPGADLVALEGAILRQDPSLAPVRHAPPTSSDCPYQGLSAFDIEDADAFHGRQAMVDAATARLERTGFLALIGASGCGKSSLALAGVGAALRDRGWSVETVLPTGNAVAALERLTHARTERGLLIVDQFEEVFQLTETDRVRICALVAEVADSGVHVLLTLRSDFLDRAAALPHIGDRIAAEVFVVATMSRADLRDAIETPARQAGLRLEAGLTELLLRDAAGSPSALPLVSHALVETWARREGSVLTVSGYEESGGIAGAVARSADSLYGQLGDDDRRLCRDIMLRLIEPGLDGHPVRRRLGADILTDDPARRAIVARLTGARLVSAEQDSLVITHEAIATAWPQLHRWLEEDAGDSRTMHQVTLGAHGWATDGERGEDLMRGTRLASAVEWRERADPVLTSTETRFLDASVAREREEVAATSARAARDRRQNRRLSVALAGAAALLVVAIVAGSVAAVRGAEAAGSAEAATAAKQDASIEAVLGASLALRGSERDVSALLAAALWTQWPDDPRARSALMGVVTASGGLMSTRYLDAEWLRGAMIPGTGDVLTVEDDERLMIRDAASGGVVHSRTPTSADGIPLIVSVSGNGTRAALVSAMDDTFESFTMTIYDLADLEPISRPVPLPAYPESLAVDTAGALVATASADGVVGLIDVASGATRSTGPLTSGVVPEQTPGAALAFTAAGDVVLGSVDPELLVIDGETLGVVHRIAVPERSAHNGLIRTASGTIVGSGELFTVAVDPDAGRVLWSHDLESSKPMGCLDLAASDATGQVYCADAFGGIREYRLTDGAPTGRTFDPQLGWMEGMGLSDDGRDLVVIGLSTPTLSLFRTDGGGAVSRITAPGAVAADGFDVDGTRIVVAERPHNAVYDIDMSAFAIWDPSRDAASLTIAGRVWGAGWMGADLIAGFRPDDESFFFLRASTGERVSGGPVPEESVRSWPSPSGRRSYMSMSDGTVAVYDGTTGESLPLEIDVDDADIPWISANRDDSLVAVTRAVDGEWVTGVFDGTTGDLVVDGLEGPSVTAFGDGEIFAAEQGRITRHDLRTLALTGSLPGAQGEINLLQLDDAGRTLLAASNDETVSLYDVASGRRLGDPIPADAPMINPGYLSPDGESFVVNVAQGVELWDARPEAQHEAACRIAGRELTDEEWDTYLPWMPEREPICAGVLSD
ncbi:MAG: BTAD domain-containing putative transcriptional regulator [Microbacterium sp.]